MPAFSDINNDGLTDMLVGNESGKLLYLENDGNDLNLVTDSFQNIDIGDFSTPQLFDLDNDGDDDLIIGERSGNFNYYENTGNSVFSYITDSLGKVNVTDYSLSYDGYSVPSFFKVENNTYLISGSEQGQVFYYTDIDGNIEGKFTESSELHVLLDTADISFDRGMRTSATIVDFYNNDKIEMMVGNFYGGIEYFNGNADVNSYVENIVNIAFLNSYPNPATDLLRIDYNKNDITNVSVIGSTGKRISPIYTTGGSYIELNLLRFKSGLYLVKIETENETYLSKFIISK